MYGLEQHCSLPVFFPPDGLSIIWKIGSGFLAACKTPTGIIWCRSISHIPSGSKKPRRLIKKREKNKNAKNSPSEKFKRGWGERSPFREAVKPPLFVPVLRNRLLGGNRRAGILTQNPSSVAIFNSITLAKFWVFWGWNPVSDCGCRFWKRTAIFFSLFSICPEKWKILTSAKTRLLKGFYNFLPRVHETHSESARRQILPE